MEYSVEEIEAMCIAFSEAISETSPEIFLNNGGTKLLHPSGHWSIGIYPSAALVSRGEASYELLVEPLVRLFHSRHDLIRRAMVVDDMQGMLNNLQPLAEWLGHYNYELGIAGETPWGKLQLQVKRGVTKLIQVFAGN